MSYKESCRTCGTYLRPISTCTVCKEYVSWICAKCEKVEDITHTHNVDNTEQKNNTLYGYLGTG